MKKNWLVLSKATWPKQLEMSKMWTLMGCFWPKYIMFEVKKEYAGVMLDANKDWNKLWGKIDACFQKWHEELSKFSPEHVGKSKNWDFDGILLSKMSWQWSLSWHDNHSKFEADCLVSSKLTLGSWPNLIRELGNLTNVHFNV